MKSPREILLARHRDAGPKLDPLRAAAVAAASGSFASPAPSSHGRRQHAGTAFLSFCLHTLGIPWRELVLANRRAWTGLAAVWAVLIVINLLDHDPAGYGKGNSRPAPPMMMSWQAQQRWMNELITDRSAPPVADRPRNETPRPRTEYSRITTV